MRESKQTEAQPLGKENEIGVARLRTWLGNAIAGKEKPVKSTPWVCTPGMAGLRLGESEGRTETCVFSPSPRSAGVTNTQPVLGSYLLLPRRRPELVTLFPSSG